MFLLFLKAFVQLTIQVLLRKVDSDLALGIVLVVAVEMVAVAVPVDRTVAVQPDIGCKAVGLVDIEQLKKNKETFIHPNINES